MFARRNRLSRQGFDLLQGASRVQSPHFSISYVLSSQDGGCSVVVSKKVARFSVSRHLLKRRISAVLKPFCTKNKVVVVYARPGAGSLSYQELQKEVTGLLVQAGIR